MAQAVSQPLLWWAAFKPPPLSHLPKYTPLTPPLPQVLSSSVEPASDVWAAGVMAYQLLSGRFPFDDWAHPEAPALSLVRAGVWVGVLGGPRGQRGQRGWDGGRQMGVRGGGVLRCIRAT